jgi:membrane protein implicated in regulation of membrane protease activity
MLTRIMNRVSMPVLLLALLWPTPAGYFVRLGVAACVAAIWALQASHSKYLRLVAHRPTPSKVRFEN